MNWFSHFLFCVLTVFLPIQFVGQSFLFSEESKKLNLSPKEIFKVYGENDVFLQSDREYTNGLKFEYGRYEDFYTPSYLLMFGFSKLIPNLGKKNWQYSGVSLAHSMYTPVDLYSSSISFGERPYSSHFFINSNTSYIFNHSSFGVEISLGKQGAIVEGQKLQEPIHRFTRSAIAQGWENELTHKNLSQINLEYKTFWSEWLGFAVSGKFGNFDTSSSIGPIFRFGKIRSPVTHGFNKNDFTPNLNIGFDETEYYFYFSPTIKYQILNASLGDVRYFAEPLYTRTSMQNSNDGISNYLLYETFAPKETPTGLNFLIFNTLFNRGAMPGDQLKLFLLESLRVSRVNSGEYPLLEWFVYDTLFRNSTKGISDLSKFLAISYLNAEAPNTQKTLFLMALFYYNELNSDKNYSVPLRRFQGRFQMGFMYQSYDFFSSLGLEIESLEYYAGPNILPFHRYMSLQVGKKF